jgi:hypothetical protein
VLCGYWPFSSSFRVGFVVTRRELLVRVLFGFHLEFHLGFVSACWVSLLLSVCWRCGLRCGDKTTLMLTELPNEWLHGLLIVWKEIYVHTRDFLRA